MDTQLEKKTLREWREEGGLSQTELSDLAGCSASTVSGMESGGNLTTGRVGRAVAQVLGIDNSQIINLKIPKGRIDHHVWPDDGFSLETPAQTLQCWREQRSISQNELVVLSGVSGHTIRHIEAGSYASKKVLPRTRRMLAEALRVSPHKLILPGDNRPTVQNRGVEDLLRSELRGARHALRKSYDVLRDDPNMSFRGLDIRDKILPDIEREIRGT